MITNRAGTIIEGSITTYIVADHLAETAVHHPAEGEIPTAQADIIHAASMDHHTVTNKFRRSPTPYAHQVSSITFAAPEPSEASSSDT